MCRRQQLNRSLIRWNSTLNKNMPMKTSLSFCKALSVIVLGASAAFFLPALTGAVPAFAASTSIAAGLPDFAELVEKTGPAVVNIRTTEKHKMAPGMPGADDDEMQE